MASVTFQCVEGVESFHVTADDGSDVAIRRGKPLTTDDPRLIAQLDAAAHAVTRAPKERGS